MSNKIIRKAVNFFMPWTMLLLGLWFSVIKVMGPHFSLLPGDLGDNRFNNYILEHFYRWITGQDASYWSASFFYPFPNTIAFGDNLLGSAIFYSFFRRLGLDRETAFQAWYIFGFILNFIAAFFILKRFKLESMAAGVGAFFFSFGLPLIGQEIHAQLFYRCGVPLACYSLWRFSQKPELWKLLLLGLCVLWQFYLSIYIGVFLIMLIMMMMILQPFFMPLKTGLERLFYWPVVLKSSWQKSSSVHRYCFVGMIPVMVFLLFLLIEPYYVVSKLYGFFRPWIVINELLPRLGSYFIADNSLIWGALSTNLQGIPARWEHQLFPGLTIIVLVIIGLIFRPKSQNQGIAWLSFWAALVLIGITLSFRGYSFYSLIWFLPGLNSIRAVTRIVLVLMWPGAVFITYVLDSFVRFEQGGRHNYGRYWFACTIVVVLLVETFVYHHSTISKVDAQNRLVASNNMIPSAIPQNPILFIASKETEPQFISDIDAMLVAQDRGWPTLNGYSGNFPGNYGIAATCLALPERIISYMKFAQISDEEYYSEMVKRVVLVGFTDCDPDGRIKIP